MSKKSLFAEKEFGSMMKNKKYNRIEKYLIQDSLLMQDF